MQPHLNFIGYQCYEDRNSYFVCFIANNFVMFMYKPTDFKMTQHSTRADEERNKARESEIVS